MAGDMVVKVGGSLNDVPELGRHLRRWLDAQLTTRVLIIPGGGAAVDLVRQIDGLDELGEESCHWLALRALQFTAHLLAARLPRGQVIEDLADRESAWQRGQIPILDMHAFAQEDDARPGHLPHRWAVTSDSLAIRVAQLAGIRALMLLKSREAPSNGEWGDTVDANFAESLKNGGSALQVTMINFRQWCRIAASGATPRDHGP